MQIFPEQQNVFSSRRGQQWGKGGWLLNFQLPAADINYPLMGSWYLQIFADICRYQLSLDGFWYLQICPFLPISTIPSPAGGSWSGAESEWIDSTARIVQGFNLSYNFWNSGKDIRYLKPDKEREIVTQEMQNDKESVISDSYGESYDQSPDAHDYYGRSGVEPLGINSE